MTPEKLKTLSAILHAVLDVIEAEPLGCPSGTIYAALMAYGCTLDQFQGILNALTKAGKIRQEGHLLFIVKKES